MKKITIETNPEFASEIVLSIPYAYYLHKKNMLEKVVTCKGMSPFYYFCDNVIEAFEYRSLDNAIGLKDIPNKWLHNSEAGGRRNGVIDYTEWICPPYRDQFRNEMFDNLKPYIVVNNIYNQPWLDNGSFDIQSLYDIFTYLIEKGYNVIYKRPTNKEFALDGNEEPVEDMDTRLCAEVEGIGIITDYELCDYFQEVININDLQNNIDYSTLNLKVFAETEGFITVNGAGSHMCACFGKPIVMHVLRSKELRPGYLEHEDCYFKMLSGAQLNPIYDDYNNWNGNPGNRKYKELIDTIKNTFKGK